MKDRSTFGSTLGWRFLVAVKTFSDAMIFALSAVLALELRFDGAIPARYHPTLLTFVLVSVAAKTLTFIAARVNRCSWRMISNSDLFRISAANILGTLLGASVLLLAFGPLAAPRTVYILDLLLACTLSISFRLLFGVAINSRPRAVGERVRRVLVYGAGSASRTLVQELKNNRELGYQIVGLIDDREQKNGLLIGGVRVLGTGEDLVSLVDRYKVERILIAVPSASAEQMARILNRVAACGVDYLTVPCLGELIQGTDLGRQIRNVAVEDLLGRKPVQLDHAAIDSRIRGKVIMVTGAAGSIGSEICRQIARFRPKALIGFDAAETPLFYLDRQLKASFPDLNFHSEIGSVTHQDTVTWTIQRYRPSIVYHAAAYKHVPLMEMHVFSAVQNNIFGTWRTAQAAARGGVETFVLISTDKAVRPSSVMGTTKRIAELAIRACDVCSKTRFMAVRFGNVLGSNGSVVPIFKEQIAAGGPVTVTHPEMRRFFMTMPEAAQLVIQASCLGRGGEVFVLDMGHQIRIADLARNLILLSGLQPGRDIKIHYIGKRPGEKLFEELNLDEENMVATAHPKIMSYIDPGETDAEQIRTSLQELHTQFEERDLGALLNLMRELVPEYTPSADLLQACEMLHSPIDRSDIFADWAAGHKLNPQFARASRIVHMV